MQSLQTILKNKLKNAKKVAVIGIGSELRSDDAAGLLVAEELRKSEIPKLKVFIGATAPENLTGEIIKYKPSHIIIIDTAEMDQKPGSTISINAEEAGGVSFSSHMLPIKMMVDYLSESLESEILIIGIQPKSLMFDAGVSEEVKKSVKKISNLIQKILQEE